LGHILNSGEVVSYLVFVEDDVALEAVATEDLAYHVLLFGRQHHFAILVAVIGSFAAKIVGQCYAYVVTGITAVELLAEIVESHSHPDAPGFLIVAAGVAVQCCWKHTFPPCHTLGCLPECQVAQAVLPLGTFVAGTEGPPIGYFFEINHIFYLCLHNIHFAYIQ